MSVLRRIGRFTKLSDDAICQRKKCSKRLDEHVKGSYGPPQARVDVLAVCPDA